MLLKLGLIVALDGARLIKHLLTKFHWQVAGGQHLDRNTQQVFKLNLKSAQIKKRRAGQRVNQQIEIATVQIRPQQC